MPSGVALTIPEAIEQALRYHRAGNWQQAEAIYREVLRVQPDNAKVLQLLGEIARRTGRHESAIQFLEKAISIHGSASVLHYELGAALHGAGQLQRAELNFRRAMERDPGHLPSYVFLGAVQLDLGKPDAAEQTSRAALQREPTTLDAYINLGSALMAQGKLEDAAAAHREALKIDPDCVPVLCNHASLCLKLGMLDEGQVAAERALRMRPGFFEAQVNLGNILIEKMQLERAIEALQTAVRWRPDAAMAHLSLGYAHAVKGEFARAMTCYESALARDPDCVPAHLYRGRLLLLQANYADAWKELEWRLRAQGHEPLHQIYARVPRWDGSSLAGRKILVYGEQGLGDEIMFASCLPEIIEHASACVIDCDPRLAPIFRRSFPRASVHERSVSALGQWLGDLRPEVAIPMGSVPVYLRRLAADFPRHSGYLRAAPERVGAWRSRLASIGAGPKIGLSWRGGVVETGRSRRSLTLDQLLPVLRRPGATFVSLQYGDCGGELLRLREEHGIEIRHWQEAIDDYDETAALVSALDLTISVCTAVVHLGGALGRPVWVMAPLFPEARYGLRGDAMPWYPAVRMFRQNLAGRWDDVIEAVARQIGSFRPGG